jgi:predicted HicB family RNase H-like nuclease
MANKENLIDSQSNVSMPIEKKCSGKISLRVPKTLHWFLVMEAKDEGVSLNQLLLAKISDSLYKTILNRYKR